MQQAPLQLAVVAVWQQGLQNSEAAQPRDS
jgi:hypothetical protein